MVNLGITAHSFHWEPNDGVTPDCIWPWVQGKMMPAKICGMMNVVAYGDIQTRERGGRSRSVRVLHTNKTENYYAKCQMKNPDGSPVFPTGDIVNPTLPGVMEAIRNGREQVSDQNSVRRDERSVRRGRRAAAAGSVRGNNR
jgi:hypothetical protein